MSSQKAAESEPLPDWATPSNTTPKSPKKAAPNQQHIEGLRKFLETVKPGFGELYAELLQKGGFETGRALSLASAENLVHCGVALGEIWAN